MICEACKAFAAVTAANDLALYEDHRIPTATRRAMAIRAWSDGDLRLAMRLLEWTTPQPTPQPSPETVHQTRQAATPLWRWQMAS